MAMDEFHMIDNISMGFDMDSEMNFSTQRSSTTTTTTSLEEEAYWNTSCSPVLDWPDISTTTGDMDFHSLIESMMDDTETDPCLFYSESGSSSETAMSPQGVNNDIHDAEDSKGLRLVHLLMAAAEALTGANANKDLAKVILVRIKELASITDGTNMERLAAYFSDALSGLLECGTNTKHPGLMRGAEEHRAADVIAAFQLLQDMSPYVKFGHFTANQAILEAVTQERRIHIVDYDIMEGIQWASLMQALVDRKEGLPAPHLRITALSRGPSGRRSIGTVQETGRRLVAFAASIGLPFSFHQCKLDSDETFRPLSVKIARGEVLVMNCMLHLPHFSYRAPSSVASFLSGAKALNPRLITLVEEEVRPEGEAGFINMFMDTLHHYSALYDSLEAGFPLQKRARALVEKVFLGPRIAGSLARIYRQGGEEFHRSWSEWLGARGCKPVRISFANHCQATLLLGLFNGGYRVEELSDNRLVIGWKTRRLLTASIWTSAEEDQMN